MDIEKDSNREAFEAWFESRYGAHFMQFALDLDMYVDKHTQTCWEAWQAAKAQAEPNAKQALHDRLLVKSIREHVEGHISEISVNDLFDKGWLAAMKCIQNNIDMLEAQEPTND